MLRVSFAGAICYSEVNDSAPAKIKIMQRIIKLDEHLSTLFTDFQNVANELSMDEICGLEDEETIALQKYAGIYRIDVSSANFTSDLPSWIEEFRAEWEHNDYVKKFTPNFKLKRIAYHKELTDWMPLYLGKSKNVGKRVLEHINLGLEKTTFALKLKARPSMQKRCFRLHALRLPVKNYNLIVPALESALRERYQPLVGKQ